MTSKSKAYHYIKLLAEKQILTREEVMEAYEAGSHSELTAHRRKKTTISELLYYIGGAVIFLGIAILLNENWNKLGFFIKLATTLGVAIITYLTGIGFSKNQQNSNAASAFFLISALLMPVGLGILFDPARFDYHHSGTLSLIALISFLIYFFSYLLLRKNILLFFSILFGTVLFFSFTNYLQGTVDFNSSFKNENFYAYRILLIGIIYLLLARYFSHTERAPLSSFLNHFGILGFLGAAFTLGNYAPEQNLFWELLFPFLALATLVLSVQLKNRAFLIWGTIFLMFYILKITSEYFSNSLGWPFALVLAGLGMMGVGYLAFSLRKKFT